MKIYFLIAFLCTTMQAQEGGFKTLQLKESRVRTADESHGAGLGLLLSDHGIGRTEQFSIHLRAFKIETELEVWITSKSTGQYSHFTTYPFAGTSGSIGPKRQQGDLQIPEGFYIIDRFNPWSTYHLSLGLNYPNRSDRILGVKNALGGDIFIHGSTVTIGCIPITDELIEELYLLCVEAKDRGQSDIPVHLYPCRMDEEGMQKLAEMDVTRSTRALWEDMEKAYCRFEQAYVLSEVVFLENGRHRFNQ